MIFLTRVRGLAPSFLPASAARARSRSRATRARSPHRPSVRCRRRTFLNPLRQAHTSGNHDQAARLQARLGTLPRRQGVPSLLIRELREAFRVHWTTPLLFRFERLTRVARVNDQQEVPGVEIFDRRFQLDIRNAVRENRLQALFRELGAFAGVTKIVRDQIEALCLRRTVPGKIDDDSVFRLGTFQGVEWIGFQARRHGLARESLHRSENVCLRCIPVQQLNYFNAFKTAQLSLASSHYLAEAL